MVFENFFTKFYKNEDPELKWGPKVYPKYTPANPTQHLASVTGRLKHPVPTPEEITEAIDKLSWAIADISDEWGLIGGAAVVSYATYYDLPRRLNTDINVIIQPELDIKITAAEVAAILCSTEFSHDFAVKRVSGVNIPQVKVKRGKKDVLIDVEILDHHVWEERRKDYDLTLSRNKPVRFVVDREELFVLNARWMLRQKILMWNEREGGQKMMDKKEIETLCDVLNVQRRTLRMKGERDIKKLKAFLKEFDNDPMVLGSVIRCPEAFGPWYDLKWVQRAFAGFLFFAVPLAFDYFTSIDE
jgi:hypothetical protein